MHTLWHILHAYSVCILATVHSGTIIDKLDAIADGFTTKIQNTLVINISLRRGAHCFVAEHIARGNRKAKGWHDAHPADAIDPKCSAVADPAARLLRLPQTH